MTTGRPRRNKIPQKKSGNSEKQIKPKRVKRPVTRGEEKEILTLHRPRIDHSAYVDDEANETGESAIHDKWWLAAFLAHTLAYLGTSAWINYAAITNDKLPITEGTLGPIDTDALIRLCAANAIGFIAAFVAFGMIIFAINWYYWSIVGATLVASCVPFGVTIWKAKSAGGQIYYIGLAILGTIALVGVLFALMPPRRKTHTLKMLGCFKYLVRGSNQAYWLIMAWTILQAVLELWCTLSIAAVIIRFQPNAEGCTSPAWACGWGMVFAIASGLIWAQVWLATTLSEVLNATLAAGVFSKASKQGISLEGYRFFGSLARNAFFSDTVEALVLPLEVLDMIPIVNKGVANCMSWYLKWLCGALEKYNKFIGVTVAIKRFTADHKGARTFAYSLVKRGNGREELRGKRDNTIGRPMSDISRILRFQVQGDPINGEWYNDGLGAFMGSHISKSLLAGGAISSGLLAAGAIYSAMIFGSNGPDISFSAWDWAIVVWSFVSAYTIAYHLLMVIDASVCSIYLMIQESSAEIVKGNLPPLKHIRPFGPTLPALSGIWLPCQMSRQINDDWRGLERPSVVNTTQRSRITSETLVHSHSRSDDHH